MRKRITTNSSCHLWWGISSLDWERIFSFSHEDIEADTPALDGAYQGISREALYTSYADFSKIFEQETELGTWVDLGAGIGQGCLMYAKLNPDKRAIAVEWVESRLQAGQKIAEQLKLANIEFFCRNLLRDPIPVGDTYFLYFPTGMVLDRILKELAVQKRPMRLIAIESHGDLFPRLEKESWLTLVKEIPLSSPRHHPMARVFVSNESTRGEVLPHDLSFQEKFFLIEEVDGRQWWGDSIGLEWCGGELYSLKYPPRSVQWSRVTEISSFEDLSPLCQFAISLRKLGEVTVVCGGEKKSGFIRKILIHPSFTLEISSGEQVEWEKIQTIFWGHSLCYDSSSLYFSLPLALLES